MAELGAGAARPGDRPAVHDQHAAQVEVHVQVQAHPDVTQVSAPRLRQCGQDGVVADHGHVGLVEGPARVGGGRAGSGGRAGQVQQCGDVHRAPAQVGDVDQAAVADRAGQGHPDADDAVAEPPPVLRHGLAQRPQCALGRAVVRPYV